MSSVKSAPVGRVEVGIVGASAPKEVKQIYTYFSVIGLSRAVVTSGRHPSVYTVEPGGE